MEDYRHVGAGQAGFNAADNQVLALFYMASKYMPALSEQEGRPVAHQVEMVEIRQIEKLAGTVKLEVDNRHRQRFPVQYAAFKANREQIGADGTPIETLFPGNPEIVTELKYSNIHTVEQLRAAPDSAGAKLPFLTTWKKKASDYLASVEKGKGFHALDKRIQEQDAVIRELQAALASLTEKKVA